MIDSIILYFKYLPQSFNSIMARFKMMWKLFAIILGIYVVLIIATEIVFKFSHITDVGQIQWLYRLCSLMVVVNMIITIYKGYQYYAKDFLVAKAFNLSAGTLVIVPVILSLITAVITMLLVVIAKPVNYETSVIAIVFYLIAMLLFISLCVVTFGLLKLIFKNIDIIYYVISVLVLISVPIIFIPNPNHVLITHLLMLNPVFYVVNGLSQSALFGIASIGNIPYHLYYILILCAIAVINFILVRYITQRIYRKENR